MFGRGSHEELVVGVEAARHRPRQEEEPQDQLLVSPVLADVGKDLVEIHLWFWDE